MKKRLMILFMAFCLVMTYMPTVAFASGGGRVDENIASTVVASGVCGEDPEAKHGSNFDDVTWTLDSEGTLTISGTGEGRMASYGVNLDGDDSGGETPKTDRPWKEYYDQIKKVVIHEGITKLGAFAFYGLSNLEKIQIADSVDMTSRGTFANCPKLTEITFPSKVKTFYHIAFADCTLLKTITCGPVEFNSSPFKNCTALDTFNIYGDEKLKYNAFNGCADRITLNVTPEAYAKYETDSDWKTNVFENKEPKITILANAPEITKYEVNFNSNGGSDVDSISNVTSGSKIAEPTAPTKTGFTFGGWYKDSEYKTKWDFDTDTVAANITLYAKWTAVTNATVKVGSITLSESLPYWKNGGATGTQDDYNAYFDATTKTLYLNGANITVPDTTTTDGSHIYGIHSNGDLNLILEGENTINVGTCNKDSMGIRANKLTISGNGSINISCGDGESSYGLYGSEITINESVSLSAEPGQVKGNGASGNYNSCGIYSSGAVSISENARVTAIGNNKSFSNNSNVHSHGINGTKININLSNGMVISKGVDKAFSSKPNFNENAYIKASTNITDKLTNDYVEANFDTYKAIQVGKVEPSAPSIPEGDVVWGIAGEGNIVPETWVGGGTIEQAMTYVNQLNGIAYIQLQKNVDITNYLGINNGKTVILDLNGKTIDRGLTNKEVTVHHNSNNQGCAISNNGNLTIKDSGTTGKITGARNGFSDFSAGAIYNKGTLTLDGGTIEGNYAVNWGGGVYNTGTLTMNGGTITGNYADYDNNRDGHGGAIYNGGTFNYNGGIIKDNKECTNDSNSGINGNVYLTSNNVINVNATSSSNDLLPTDAEIWVTTYDNKAGIIAKASEGKTFTTNDLAKFHSDYGFKAELSEDSTAIKFVVPTYTVTFEVEDGDTTSITQQTVELGKKIIEPNVTDESGKYFDGWYTLKTSDKYENPWDFTNQKVTEDITLYARWITEPHKCTVDNQVNNLSHVPAVAPTCTEDGNIEYYICVVCQQKYDGNDPQTATKLEDADVIRSAAHIFNPDFDKCEEIGHGHTCLRTGCETVSQLEAHVYDNDQDEDCNICGYKRTISSGETGGSTGGGSYIPPTIDNTDLNHVKELIDAIGTVTVDKQAQIEEAREAYEKLTDAKQAKVDNYQKLADAEKALKDKLDLIAKIQSMQLAARSKVEKSPSGKSAIRIFWYEVVEGKLIKLDANAFEKVEIFRALKKDGDYGDTPVYVSGTDRYYNTAVKKGTRYFYKVKGYVTIDDVRYYTKESLRAWRTAK